MPVGSAASAAAAAAIAAVTACNANPAARCRCVSFDDNETSYHNGYARTAAAQGTATTTNSNKMPLSPTATFVIDEVDEAIVVSNPNVTNPKKKKNRKNRKEESSETLETMVHVVHVVPPEEMEGQENGYYEHEVMVGGGCGGFGCGSTGSGSGGRSSVSGEEGDEFGDDVNGRSSSISGGEEGSSSGLVDDDDDDDDNAKESEHDEDSSYHNVIQEVYSEVEGNYYKAQRQQQQQQQQQRGITPSPTKHDSTSGDNHEKQGPSDEEQRSSGSRSSGCSPTTKEDHGSMVTPMDDVITNNNNQANSPMFNKLLKSAKRHPQQFLQWQKNVAMRASSSFTSNVKGGQNPEQQRVTAADIKAAKKWKSVFDPKSSRVYYYHVKTREVSWIKPLGFGIDVIVDQDGGSGSGSKSSEEKGLVRGGREGGGEVAEGDDDKVDNDVVPLNKNYHQQATPRTSNRRFLSPPSSHGVRSFTPLHWEILPNDTNVSALTGMLSARGEAMMKARMKYKGKDFDTMKEVGGGGVQRSRSYEMRRVHSAHRRGGRRYKSRGMSRSKSRGKSRSKSQNKRRSRSAKNLGEERIRSKSSEVNEGEGEGEGEEVCTYTLRAMYEDDGNGNDDANANAADKEEGPPQALQLMDVLLAAACDLEHQRSMEIVGDITKYEEEILRSGSASVEEGDKEASGGGDEEALPRSSGLPDREKVGEMQQQQRQELSSSDNAVVGSNDNADGARSSGDDDDDDDDSNGSGNGNGGNVTKNLHNRGAKFSSLVKNKFQSSRSRHEGNPSDNNDDRRISPESEGGADAAAAPSSDVDNNGATTSNIGMIANRGGKISSLVKNKLKSSRIIRHGEKGELPAASSDKEVQLQPSPKSGERETQEHCNDDEVPTAIKNKLKSSRDQKSQQHCDADDAAIAIASSSNDGKGKLEFLLINNKLKSSRFRHDEERSSNDDEVPQIPPKSNDQETQQPSDDEVPQLSPESVDQEAQQPRDAGGDDNAVTFSSSTSNGKFSLIKNKLKSSLFMKHGEELPSNDADLPEFSPGPIDQGSQQRCDAVDDVNHITPSSNGGNGKFSLIKNKLKSSKKFSVNRKVRGEPMMAAITNPTEKMTETTEEELVTSSPASIPQQPPPVRIDSEESEIELTYHGSPLFHSLPAERSVMENSTQEVLIEGLTKNSSSGPTVSKEVSHVKSLSAIANKSPANEDAHTSLALPVDTLASLPAISKDIPGDKSTYSDFEEVFSDACSCDCEDFLLPEDVSNTLVPLEEKQGPIGTSSVGARAKSSPKSNTSTSAGNEITRIQSNHVDPDEVMCGAFTRGICHSSSPPPKCVAEIDGSSTANKGYLAKGLAKSSSAPANRARGLTQGESSWHSKLASEESEIGLTYGSLTTMPMSNPQFPGTFVPPTPPSAARETRSVQSELPAQENNKKGGLFKKLFVCDTVPLHACYDSSPTHKNNGCGGSIATKECSTLSGELSDESTLVVDNQYLEDDPVVHTESYAPQRQEDSDEKGDAHFPEDSKSFANGKVDYDDDDSSELLSNEGVRGKSMKMLACVSVGTSTKGTDCAQGRESEKPAGDKSDDAKGDDNGTEEDASVTCDGYAVKEKNGISKHWKVALEKTLKFSNRKTKGEQVSSVEPLVLNESINGQLDVNQSLNIEWDAQESNKNGFRRKLSKKLTKEQTEEVANCDDVRGTNEENALGTVEGTSKSGGSSAVKSNDSGNANSKKSGSLVTKKQMKTLFKPLKEKAKEMKMRGDKFTGETVEDKNRKSSKTLVDEKIPIGRINKKSNQSLKVTKAEGMNEEISAKKAAEDKNSIAEKAAVKKNSTIATKVEEHVHIEDDVDKYWKATLDATTGKTYYYNKKTRAVTWTNPTVS